MTDLTDTTENTGNYAAPPRSPIAAVRVCFAKYFDFSGRASCSEFWWFVLFIALCVAAVIFLSTIPLWMLNWHVWGVVFLCSVTVGLMTLLFWVPFFAVGARRLHDTGRSDWRLLMLVPFSTILALFSSGVSIKIVPSGFSHLFGPAYPWLEPVSEWAIHRPGVISSYLSGFTPFSGVVIVAAAVMVCLPILSYWWAQPGPRQPNQYDHGHQPTHPQVVIPLLMGLPLVMVALHIIGSVAIVLSIPYVYLFHL